MGRRLKRLVSVTAVIDASSVPDSGAAMLEEAVRGVLQQAGVHETELIVGVSPATGAAALAALERWQGYYSERMYIVAVPAGLTADEVWRLLAADARGDYLALCSPTVRWCSDSKVSRQADWLDAHDGCALCFHSLLCTAPGGRLFLTDRSLATATLHAATVPPDAIDPSTAMLRISAIDAFGNEDVIAAAGAYGEVRFMDSCMAVDLAPRAQAPDSKTPPEGARPGLFARMRKWLTVTLRRVLPLPRI